jgi:hypothetical protein
MAAVVQIIHIFEKEPRASSQSFRFIFQKNTFAFFAVDAGIFLMHQA